MGEQSKLYITEVNQKLGDLKAAFSELNTASEKFVHEWQEMASYRNAQKPTILFRDRLGKYSQACTTSEAKTLTALADADKVT